MQQEGRPPENDHSDHIGSLTLRVKAPRTHQTSYRKPNSDSQNQWFTRTVARLLECNRCYAAFLSPKGDTLDQVSVGLRAPKPASEALARCIAENFSREGSFIYQSSVSPNSFARRLIGTKAEVGRHSVIGRLCAVSGDTAIFIAGWRSMPIAAADFTSATRAIELLWDAVTELDRASLHANQRWLDDIEPPALTVDENLIVHNMNGAFRRLVAEGVITVDHGILSGATPLITARIKEAVRASIVPGPKQGPAGSTVLISQDEQRFLFAAIGTIPGNADPALALIYVPQFDEDTGARRIALAFNLSWVETRIVRSILGGRCPRAIGAELGFTEETVRTYIKRIMLKIGINRQSEFFVLHSQTFSPFKSEHSAPPCIATP